MRPFTNLKLVAMVLFVLAGLNACSAANTESPERAISSSTACGITKGNGLRIDGLINARMLSCVEKTLTPEITHITVNSGGGDVLLAHRIAYQIAQHPRTLIIESKCLSSCANYFIPAARKIVLKPSSVIGLHGTPDGAFLNSSDLEELALDLEIHESSSSEGARRKLRERKNRNETLRNAEEQFNETFNVSLGWRLYRDADDPIDGWRRHFKAGSDENVKPDMFMIVEETMLRTCLPHLEVEPFQTTLEQTVFENPDLWTGLRKRIGAYRSQNLTCRDAAFSDP